LFAQLTPKQEKSRPFAGKNAVLSWNGTMAKIVNVERLGHNRRGLPEIKATPAMAWRRSNAKICATDLFA